MGALSARGARGFIGENRGGLGVFIFASKCDFVPKADILLLRH